MSHWLPVYSFVLLLVGLTPPFPHADGGRGMYPKLCPWGRCLGVGSWGLGPHLGHPRATSLGEPLDTLLLSFHICETKAGPPHLR